MQSQAKQRGFTIIEVMIAMAIFTVIVTIGIGAILDAITQHHSSENMRTVMDNLSFVMEDMARNIRLGTNVHCITGGETTVDGSGSVIPQSCPAGSNKITFNDLNGNILTYTIVSPLDPIVANRLQIFKEKDIVAGGAVGAGSPEDITPPEVHVDFAKSGFTVRGAETSASGDLSQPTVVIHLSGTIVYKNIVSKFSIQTTTALRALDT